jgi:hypothetical protein
MRKIGFDSTTLDEQAPAHEACLDLDEIAQVAVTSEDPDFPIESAFLPGATSGWRAGKRRTDNSADLRPAAANQPDSAAICGDGN